MQLCSELVLLKFNDELLLTRYFGNGFEFEVREIACISAQTRARLKSKLVCRTTLNPNCCLFT
jgi:hypothetical protein